MSTKNNLLLRYKNRAENDDSCIVPIEFLYNANMHFKYLSIDVLRYIFITMLGYYENKDEKTFVGKTDISLLQIPRIIPIYNANWQIHYNYVILYERLIMDRPSPFRQYVYKQIYIYYTNAYYLLNILYSRSKNDQDKDEEPSKFIVSFVFEDYEMIYRNIKIYNVKTNTEIIRRHDLEKNCIYYDHDDDDE